MLIWINGAHGAGKTSLARTLVERLPDAALVDPEQIGFLLRRIWPRPLPDDFKDLPIWRKLTLETLLAATRTDAAILVVPMTLYDPTHFQEIVGGLRSAGANVRHFTLMASRRTLERRLRWRLDWPSSRRWSISGARRSEEALRDPRFATHIDTDGRQLSEVAQDLLQRLGGGG